MIPGEQGNGFEAWRVIEGRIQAGGARLTLLAVDLCASKFQCGHEFREAGASRPGSQARAWEPVNATIDIPEPLYRKAKIRAVQQGTSLVLRALEQALSSAGAVTPEVPCFARRKLNAELQGLMDSGVLRPRPEGPQPRDFMIFFDTSYLARL